jgi:hypothetical protein
LYCFRLSVLGDVDREALWMIETTHVQDKYYFANRDGGECSVDATVLAPDSCQ